MSKRLAAVDDALQQVALFCENRVPVEARDEVRLEFVVRGGSITLVERRSPFSVVVGPEWTSMKIAQLRFDQAAGRWTLYAAGRNERWSPYDAEPAADIGPLLAEIADDPSGIFWG